MKRIISLAALLTITLVSAISTSCSPAVSHSINPTANRPGGVARIKISNDYYRVMVVRLERIGGANRKDITIPARSSRSLKVPSGSYKISTKTKGFQVSSTYKQLEPRRSYSF